MELDDQNVRWLKSSENNMLENESIPQTCGDWSVLCKESTCMIAWSTCWKSLRSCSMTKSHSCCPGVISLFKWLKRKCQASIAQFPHLTEVAKRLIDSETLLVCVASCCQSDASFELMIKIFEHSTIRQAPSTTLRADDTMGSANERF